VPSVKPSRGLKTFADALGAMVEDAQRTLEYQFETGGLDAAE
jgi:hypothetical protein